MYLENIIYSFTPDKTMILMRKGWCDDLYESRKFVPFCNHLASSRYVLCLIKLSSDWISPYHSILKMQKAKDFNNISWKSISVLFYHILFPGKRVHSPQRQKAGLEVPSSSSYSVILNNIFLSSVAGVIQMLRINWKGGKKSRW